MHFKPGNTDKWEHECVFCEAVHLLAARDMSVYQNGWLCGAQK